MRKLLISAVFLRSAALADEGTLQFRAETRDLTVTLFTVPAPLTAGPVDLSVLVQSRYGLEPVLDAEISVEAHALDSRNVVIGGAKRQQAQNRLLYAVPLTLAESGKWRIDVTVRRGDVQRSVAGLIDVAPRQTTLASYWEYLAYPPVVMTSFLVHGWLVRRKRLSREILCETTWN